MTVAQTHDAFDQGETPSWAWPLHALVAWLATILDYVARFKRIRRTHTFSPDWRDNWEGLRQAEWLRDQLIAQGVRQLLNGEDIKLDDTQIILEPPASYGGPCPRTPFDMNRRFIALARWAANPEAIIRERFRRASRAAVSVLHTEEDSIISTRRRLSPSAASRRGRRLAASLRRDGGGSRCFASTARPRAPPAFPYSQPCLARAHPRERARLRAILNRPIPPPMTTRAALLQLKRKAMCLAPARR